MKRLLPAFLLVCVLSGAAAAGTLLDEDFEGIFPLSDWTAVSIDQTNTYAHTGRYSARLNAVGDCLITPILATPETLTLWTYTTAADPGIIVEQGSGTNGPWAAVSGSPFNGNTGQWNQRTISISSSSGLCFRFTKSGSGILYIDDVSVKDGGTISNRPPVLDPIGDRSVFETETLSFVITASHPIDRDPVMLSAANLPTGAVFTNGVFTWSRAAPVGAYAVTFYATDKNGSDSETIAITVVPRPQLLISEIADPDGIGGDGYRFVELYNAGTNAINLASNRWYLSRQNNGADWSDIPLTGTVSAAGAYLIAKNRSDFSAAYGFYPQQESSGVDGNGNDTYSLYCGGNHASGTLIDIYGQTDTIGTGTSWEYTDSRAARNNSILQPNDVWTSSEWTITSRAATSNMTPGLHGPVPEFQGMENPFVFLGDSLRLTVTSVNTVRTDVIRLSAAALPAGATFAAATGTNAVSSTLNWASPTTGVYAATFAAAGFAGTNIESVTITVSSGSRMAGNFYGWSGDTIFKLVNGQFWQQSVAGSKTVSPALYRPHITITNYLGYQRRMVVTNVTGYVAVAPLAVTESAVINSFTGLHYQNIYLLADGTVWKQMSSEIISSNATSVVAWRWIKKSQQMMRFLDRNDRAIGTCAVEASATPPDIKIHSTIDGYFYGFGYGNIFHLAEGSWWRQISFERSSSTRRNPEVLIWNENGTDYLEMPDEGLRVSAEKLNVHLESAITNTFAGLHYGNTYQLANGAGWLQLSFENISTSANSPAVMLWIEGSQTNLLVRDSRDATIGTCVVADPATDSDSDGLSNVSEVAAGFDPFDSKSRFELRQTDSYVLRWDAVAGRIYTIEWSPSLAAPFQPLEKYIFWPQNSWTDTVHTGETKGFYRIGVRLVE